MRTGYMKNVKSKMLEKGKSEDDVKDFEKRAQAAAKKLLANFKDYEFYVGESMDPDGMYVSPHPRPKLLRSPADKADRVALLNYREDGVTPFMTFWKDGLVEEKV
jgi:hypothetical protein